MAQWQCLTELCRLHSKVQDRVMDLSRRLSLPYQLRMKYAAWIESQNWSDIDCNVDDCLKKAALVYEELLSKIDEDITRSTLPEHCDLANLLWTRNLKKELLDRFERNYGAFVSVMNNYLKEEKLLIESAIDNQEDPELRRKNRTQQEVVIAVNLESLQQAIMVAISTLQEVALKQREFRLHYSELTDSITVLKAKGNQLSDEERQLLQSMEQEQNRLAVANLVRRTNLADMLIQLSYQLAERLSLLCDECNKWQLAQKRAIATLSKPGEIDLEKIEKLYDQAGRLWILLVQQIEGAIALCKELVYRDDASSAKLVTLETVHQELKGYLVSHLHSGFVIDIHPDQVLKVVGGKSNGINMSVRILGGRGLGLEYTLPTVKVKILHERDLQSGLDTAEGVCKISNAESRFEVNQRSGVCCAKFDSIQLTSVRRPDRGRSEELVTENKYALVFMTTVNVYGCPIPLRTSQEAMAKGTLIWDAAFSDLDRKPFKLKESVTWAELGAVLNSLYASYTGRGLTAEHLNYLARLAFKDTKNVEDFNSRLITEKQFIREPMLGRRFSFWKWFWSNLILCKTYINDEWKAGLIYGFISREDTDLLLMESPIGTFLLRFSESNIETSQRSEASGCLTMAVVEIDPIINQKRVFHVKEYLSPKQLNERGLYKILNAMEVVDYSRLNGAKKRLLRHVWPDTASSFETRFVSHVKEKETGSTSDGYVGAKYSIEICLTDERKRSDGSSMDPMTPASVDAVDFDEFDIVLSPDNLPILDDLDLFLNNKEMDLGHHDANGLQQLVDSFSSGLQDEVYRTDASAYK